MYVFPVSWGGVLLGFISDVQVHILSCSEKNVSVKCIMCRWAISLPVGAISFFGIRVYRWCGTP